MNNKRVCLRCDDLLFDIEIECDEIETKPLLDRQPAIAPNAVKTTQKR